jgi:peptidyl-prolyl cis-trans isomerase C
MQRGNLHDGDVPVTGHKGDFHMIRSQRAMLFSLTLALAGCGDSSTLLAKLGDTSIEKAEYEAYLELKRVPKGDARRRAEQLDAYLEREALAKAIEDQKLLDDRLLQVELDELKKELLISRYFEKYLEQKVSDDAVRNYYTSHADQFRTRRVHAAHILVRTPRGIATSERQAKLTRAHEAISKLRAGQDFGKVAETYSDDQISARKGGDLGWLKEGSVDPKFSAALFKLKAGELSDPVESAFGYHIIKLLEAPADTAEPFERAANDIRYKLRVDAKQAEIKRLSALVKPELGPAGKAFEKDKQDPKTGQTKTAKR